jgi:amino acid permease
MNPATAGGEAGGARCGMNEAQLGLLLTTPTILAFVFFMYRRGAIPPAGAVAAAITATAIATVLFLAQ